MKKYSFIFLFLVMVFCLLFDGLLSPALTAKKVEEQVLRLHVLANSDEEEDQALKLKVRDSLLAAGESLFWKASSREEAEQLIRDNLELLRQAAERTVMAEGFSYPVTLSLEDAYFETRDYGDFSLPLGQYLSLKAVIGKGEGKNWWCILYPPLCLSSALREDFLSGLPQEEQTLLTDPSRFEVRLWLVEKLKQWLGIQ